MYSVFSGAIIYNNSYLYLYKIKLYVWVKGNQNFEGPKSENMEVIIFYCMWTKAALKKNPQWFIQ